MNKTQERDRNEDNFVTGRPRVVIVGGGFGGLWAAKGLGKANVEVTLMDQNNYHLFLPLLYQVATAGLSPADIAVPIRHILRDQKNTRIKMARVTGLDLEKNWVLTDGERVAFDYLVLALGSSYSYFGKEEWEEFAPSLRTIPQATDLRARILSAFERAENEKDPLVQKSLMTFVVIGGGPTGVEIAGALAELARWVLRNEFHNIDPTKARILLIEAGDRILSNFSPRLSSKAKTALESLGVEVQLQCRAEKINENALMTKNETIHSHTMIWAAGVQASKVAEWLKAETDRLGRVKVTPTLNVPNHPSIFVIGDSAYCEDSKGNPLPGVAPVAMQQGMHVARTILEYLEQKPRGRPFVYRNKGELATIGRSYAVAQFGKLELHGFLAWVVWALVHIFYLIGFQNRLNVFMQWVWAYLTYQKSARLIVGQTKK